jgi:hypothetical protein
MRYSLAAFPRISIFVTRLIEGGASAEGVLIRAVPISVDDALTRDFI